MKNNYRNTKLTKNSRFLKCSVDNLTISRILSTNKYVSAPKFPPKIKDSLEQPHILGAMNSICQLILLCLESHTVTARLTLSSFWILMNYVFLVLRPSNQSSHYEGLFIVGNAKIKALKTIKQTKI